MIQDWLNSWSWPTSFSFHPSRTVMKDLENPRRRYKTTRTQFSTSFNDKTRPDSQLRKILVSLCAFNVVGTRFEEQLNHSPQRMLSELELAKVLEDIPKTLKEQVTEKRDLRTLRWII